MAREPVVQQLLKTQTRVDNRTLNDIRPLELSFPSTYGIVEARRGGTLVTAKASLEFMEPNTKAPNRGVLNIQVHGALQGAAQGSNARLTTAQGLYCAEPGLQSSAEENEYAFLDFCLSQILIRSGVVSLETLCLEAGKLVYRLIVDIYIASNDGGLVDVGLAAASASILHVGIPPVEIDSDGKNIRQLSRYERDYNTISMKFIPVSLTYAHVKRNVKVDYIEELAALRSGAKTNQEEDTEEESQEQEDKEKEKEKDNKEKEKIKHKAKKVVIDRQNSPFAHLPDPCREELFAAEGVSVIALDKSGGIAGVYKMSAVPFSLKEAEELLVDSVRLTAGISNKIEKLVSDDLTERKRALIERVGYNTKK